MKLLLLGLLISISQLAFGERGEVGEGGTVSIDCGDNNVEIYKAYYLCIGDGRHADKTSYLAQACNGKTSCSMGANNGVMGDPFPGCLKRFDYSWGCSHGGSVNEGGTIEIDCGTEPITIIEGYYICSNTNTDRTNQHSDETSKLATHCDGKTTCSVGANNGVFGDPFGGCYKRFDYTYGCGEAETVDEGGVITLSCGDSGTIAVDSAYYICKSGGDAGYASDKTSYLARTCNDKNECQFQGSNTHLGDPFPGCPKKFTGVYQCVPDPCEDADCSDGLYCNGEEYCSEGECVAGEEISCTGFNYVCSNEEKACVRDCSIFDFDGFMTECSDEHVANELEFEAVQSDIGRIDGRINDAEGSITDNAGAIGANTDLINEKDAAIAAVEARCNDLEADLAELRAWVNSFRPPDDQDKQSVVNPDGDVDGDGDVDAESMYLFYEQHKPEIFFFSIIANAILLLSLVYICYRKKEKKTHTRRVRVYSSDVSDDDDQRQLIK